MHTLDLTACWNVSDAGLKALSTLKHLQSLGLGSLEDKITDDGLQALAGLENLQSLDLSYAEITGEGLRLLADLPKLHTLDLEGCSELSDQGIEVLSRMEHVRTLSSSLRMGGGITDRGWQQLAQMQNLQSLDLTEHKSLADVGVQSRDRMRNLRSLDLSGSESLTDAGVQSLAQMPNLQSLDWSYCRKITLRRAPPRRTLRALMSGRRHWCHRRLWRNSTSFSRRGRTRRTQKTQQGDRSTRETTSKPRLLCLLKNSSSASTLWRTWVEGLNFGVTRVAGRFRRSGTGRAKLLWSHHVSHWER